MGVWKQQAPGNISNKWLLVDDDRALYTHRKDGILDIVGFHFSKLMRSPISWRSSTKWSGQWHPPSEFSGGSFNQQVSVGFSVANIFPSDLSHVIRVEPMLSPVVHPLLWWIAPRTCFLTRIFEPLSPWFETTNQSVTNWRHHESWITSSIPAA